MKEQYSRDLLLAYAIRYKGDWKSIYEAIAAKEKISDEEIYDYQKSLNCKTLTLLDKDYPDQFKRITCPPFVLFYYGNISLLNDYEKSLGVIGTRKNTDYGEKMTRYLVSSVCDKLVIVSGLARGIDSIAADECMNHGGKTIAVLGSGIDYCYPPENEEIYERIKRNGLLISEYPNDTIPLPDNFPNRNRLIAGLSKNLLITEAKNRSGTAITARFVMEKGNVLCVPERANINSLCNSLIRDGAKLVCRPNDILEEYEINLFEGEFEK